MLIGLAISPTAVSALTGVGLAMPQADTLPGVSGAGIEGGTLSADGNDTWRYDGMPASVTSRSYQLMIDGSAAVTPQASPSLDLPSGSGGAAYLMQLRVQVAEAPGLWSAWVTIASGTIATVPQLSGVLAAQTGSDSCNAEVTTDTGSGTLYWMVTQDPTAPAEIKTGQSQPVTASGVQTVTATGLTPETTYYVHFVQENGAGQDSAPASSQAFTTEAATLVPAAFAVSDWSITDAGTGGDALLTIGALPFDGAAAINGIDWRIGTGAWVPLGAFVPGAYLLEDLFTDGVAVNITLRAVNIIGPGTASDQKQVTTSDLPGPFGGADWSIFDDATGGDATLTVISLPTTGGLPLDLIEVQIDAGAWQTLTSTPEPGAIQLTDAFVDGVQADVALRAVNANGPGPVSDVKTVTTSTASQGAIAVGGVTYAEGAGGMGPTLDITDVDLSGATGPYSVFLATHGSGTILSAGEIEAGTGAATDAVSLSDADGTVTEQGLPLSTSLSGGHLSLFVRDTLGAASSIIRLNGIDVDATAPLLGPVVATPTGATTADWLVGTDEAGGTIYVRARADSAAPWTAAEILAEPDGSVAGTVAANTAPALYGGPTEPGLIALWDARLAAGSAPDGPVTTLQDLAGPFDLTAVAAPTRTAGVIGFDGVDDVMTGAGLADTGAQLPGAVHIRDHTLPDASGSDAGQGFSIAGLAYDTADGTWWAVNGGLNFDGSTADRQQSLVHLSSDFATNLGEIDLDAVLPDLEANDESPQAVAIDNTNGYLWVGDPTARAIRCFDKATLTRLPANDITRGFDIGSLCISADGSALWVMSRGNSDATIQKISTDGSATVSVDFTIDLDNRHDHLCESDGILYVSCGTNGSQAFVVAIDPAQQIVLSRSMLPYPSGPNGMVGIEGIQIGPGGNVFVSHNGYFHYGDPQNPEAPDQWPRENIVAEYALPTLASQDLDLFALVDASPNGADCAFQFGSPLDSVKTRPSLGLFLNGSLPAIQLRKNHSSGGDVANFIHNFDGPVLIYVTLRGSTATFYINGVEAGSDTLGPDGQGFWGPAHPPELGASNSNATRHTPMDWYAGGVVLGAEADRQVIEGAIAHRHGQENLLPAAHPYKSIAP